MKILVVVDYNDADYNEHVYRDISEETLEKFRPMIEAIKHFVPYPTNLGLEWSNFPYGDYNRKYEMDVYTIYNQFSKKYIDEFIETFLSANYGEYGFHSIVEISNIVTDEVYYKELPYKERYDIAMTNPVVKSYFADIAAAKEKWATLCNCATWEVDSVPFYQMSEEAYAAYEEYNNVWRKYRSDLTD